MVAADAGLMDIEWREKAAWGVGRGVRWSTADDAGCWLAPERIAETTRAGGKTRTVADCFRLMECGH